MDSRKITKQRKNSQITLANRDRDEEMNRPTNSRTNRADPRNVPTNTPQTLSPTQVQPLSSQPDSQPNHTRARTKWSEAEYKEVMWCYLYIKESTGSCNMKSIYNLWRKRNPATRPYIEANKLATQRRYIENQKKLNEMQLSEIKADVRLHLGQTSQSPENETERSQSSSANQKDPEDEGISSQVAQSSQRIKWTQEEYKEVMWCHWYTKEGTGFCNIKETYDLWRARNPDTRLHINANKLATQRRYIENKRKLSDELLEEIKADAIATLEASTEEHAGEAPQVAPDALDDILSQDILAELNISNQASQTPPGNQQPTSDELTETNPEPLAPTPEPKSSQNEKPESPIRRLYQEVLEMTLEEREPIRKLNGAKKEKEILARANSEVKTILETEQELDLWKINCLLYAAALTVSDEANNPRPVKKNNAKETKPLWQKRIDNRIKELRCNLSVLTNFKETSKSNEKPMTQRVKSILEKYTDEGEEYNIDNVAEQLKQRISVFSQRIRRYKKRSNQYRENRMFVTNCKSFYRKIKGDGAETGATPKKQEIEEFWKGIYETPTEHNTEADWIKDLNVEHQMEWTPLNEAEVANVLKNLANWKAPGPDKIQSFWYKKMHPIHKYLTTEYIKLLGGEEFPPWLAKGCTYLIPKNKETANPKNFRPITCLNIMYKIYTALMAGKTYKYLESAELLPIEQKGCRKGANGCLDQLLISKTAIEDCKRRKKNLSVAWLDYQKAFDSMPHSWIIRALEIMGVHPNLVNACKNMMKHWATVIQLNGNAGQIVTSEIKIRRGIYQGDAFSPLLFCIGLIPLSKKLNEQQNGYDLEDGYKQLTHLLYMDDLKLFSSNETKLQQQLKTVKEFSDDIGMKFGLDKCAKVTFKKGKFFKGENVTIDNETSIRQLDPGETYKYLGMEENSGVQNTTVKEKVKKEYIRRVRAVLKTELSAKNKISAIGALAVPVLQYGFAILDWKMTEIRALDVKTRKYLTMYKMHHPSADVHRLYVSRKLGGRGLRQIEAAYKSTIISTKYYLRKKRNEDLFLKSVHEADTQLNTLHSITKKADKFETELEQNFEQTPVKSRNQTIKKKIAETLRSKWTEKNMHGQYPRLLEEDRVESTLSTMWLSKGALKGETESLIAAAQDQALNTRYRDRKIHGRARDSKCRICHQHEETIDHIISACPILAKKDYIERHDRVCTHLHHNLCKEYNIAVETNWYEHKPKAITATDDGQTTIIWNVPVRTDRTVPNNRPDIILRKRGQTCLLIDVSIPADRNISLKEAEKRLKYKDLEIEISRMWKTDTKVIPFVIGATGAVSKEWKKFKEEIPGKHSLVTAQKAAILGTARILRKVLS